MTLYQHTQSGSKMTAMLVALAAVTAITGFRIAPSPVFLIVPVILVLTAFIFFNLTIRIENGTLRASFGPGLVNKEVQLAEIVDCEPIRIRWWYGWGIHLTPYGWLYNIAGWDAVAIRLRNGRRLALGTDQPNELTAAIRRFASAR